MYQDGFGGPLNGGTDYSDNWGTPGQTFTVGASPITVTAITIKGAGSYGGFDLARYWVLSISTATGTASGTLGRVTQEISTGFVPAAGDSYLTFTLATPVVLAANTIYEYDIFTTDSSVGAPSANGGWYGFAKSTSDLYAGGVAMQNGYQSENSRQSANPGTINTPQSYDRTFFITAVPEPSSALLAGGTLMLAGLIRRRRRMEA